MKHLYTVDESEKLEFVLDGQTYYAYRRFYNDGTSDIEVELKDNEGEDVESRVYDYAEALLERE
jgi:hypothetical protein